MYKIITLLLLLSSCKKMVEIDPPVGEVITATVFSNDQTATASVLGLYSQAMATNNSFANGAITVYTGLSSDELYNTSTDASTLQFTQNELAANNTTIRSLWQRAYGFIYQANAVIKGLESSVGLTDSVKTQLLGEAYLFRAFCHFYLANLFGDIPLLVSPDFKANAVMPRSSVIEVFMQVKNDLLHAHDLLSVAYATAGRVRPNKYTAAAFLSRIYLFMQDWTNAEAKATEVISAGSYLLEPDLKNVFVSASKEAIWHLMPVAPNFNTYEGFNFIPFSATTVPAYPVTLAFLNAFETGDARKTSWLKTVSIGSNTYSYPFKYKLRNVTPVTEYYTMIRLAEVYLNRAEARAQQNKIAEANTDINTIRSRASLPVIAVTDKSALLQTIYHERQIELFAEWGHRWLDLKRTAKADATLAPLKQGWQPTDALYPIPQSELELNVFLTQNPGY